MTDTVAETWQRLKPHIQDDPVKMARFREWVVRQYKPEPVRVHSESCTACGLPLGALCITSGRPSHIDCGDRCSTCNQTLGPLHVLWGRTAHMGCDGQDPGPWPEHEKDQKLIRRRDEIAETMRNNPLWGEEPWWMAAP